MIYENDILKYVKCLFFFLFEVRIKDYLVFLELFNKEI